MTTPNAVETLALGKMVKKGALDKAREVLSAGSYELDCLIRLTGTMNIGQDYKQNKTASMPQIKMLLAAIMLNGISVKAFVRRYLDNEFEVSKEQEAEMKEVWGELADEFEGDFKGKVTTKLNFEKVAEEVEAKQVEVKQVKENA